MSCHQSAASALIAALAGGAVITAAAVRGASMGTIATAMAVTALGLLFLAVFMRHRMPMIEPGALLIARMPPGDGIELRQAVLMKVLAVSGSLLLLASGALASVATLV